MSTLTIAVLAGIWSTTCIQSQIEERTGYARETYTIEKSGKYEFKREWFRDAQCQSKIEETNETGKLKVGSRIAADFAGETNSYALDYETKTGVAHGAVRKSGKNLRFARGTPGDGNRNTMVGIFDYARK